MKRFLMLFSAAIGLLLGSEGVLTAGVVMSETSFVNGTIAPRQEHRTIYTEGNKQKIDMDGVQTIADLDKHQLYIVDKDRRNYAEMPLEHLKDLLPSTGEPNSKPIDLRRTGATRVVAHNRCDEYRGKKVNERIQITVSACVSRNAPGADQIVRFDRKMVSRLLGVTIATSNQAATGMVLEKKSIVNFTLPGPSQQNYHRIASLTTSTRVDYIDLKALPAQTFLPPKGYNKVQGPLPMNFPEHAQSIVLKESRSLPICKL
jgi:hypothetical protein